MLNVITVNGTTKGFRSEKGKCSDSCGYRGKDQMWCNILNDWDYCTPSNPCDTSEKINHCCNKWSEKIGHNLKALMKVMRFASRRGNSGFTLRSILQDPTDKLFYPLKDKTTERKVDKNSFLPWCNLRNDEEKVNSYDKSSCKLSQPVFTDIGMCHSFNPTPVADVLKPSYYRQSFIEGYREDLLSNEKLHMGVKSGKALDFYLLGTKHREKTEVQANIFTNENYDIDISKFLVGVSNKHQYIDMKAISETIRAGYHETWKIQAMEIVPSNDLRDVPIAKRKCKFEDEIEGMEIFKIYSQAACEFEFKVKKARDICNCVPWYIPTGSMSRYEYE